MADWEQKAEPAPPSAVARMGEVMQHRLATAAGQAKYKLRQQTVEPVLGIIKSVPGSGVFCCVDWKRSNWNGR